MRNAMRFYLFVAAVLLGATIALALGTAGGRIAHGCPAEHVADCRVLIVQSGQ